MSLGRGIGYPTKVTGSTTAGTVTSVSLTAASIFTVGGSPITVSGTLVLDLASQAANKVFASPNGSAGVPTFRALVAADIPSLPYGTGTVTSVGLTVPGIFTVGGSPVTSSGSLSLALASQTANKVFASPNGSTGAPTFRALVAADLPAGIFGWALNGNAGTTFGTNFIGTIDNTSLSLKTNSTQRMFIGTNGEFGIGGANIISGAGVGLGYGASGTGISIGINSNSVGQSFSFGENAISTVNYGVAIGQNAKSQHAGAIVISDGSSVPSFITSDAANQSKWVQGGGFKFNKNNAISFLKIGVSVGKELEVIGNAIATNIYTTSATPSIVLNAGAGSGSTVSIAGTNQAGTITINIGTGAVAFGSLFTITQNAFTAPTGLTLLLVGISTHGSNLKNDSTTANTTTTNTVFCGVTPPPNGALIQLNYFIFPY